MDPLIYIFAYHVDPTTLANGDYELISNPAVEVPEDPENAVEGLTEAPNPLFYLHCNLYLFI
jgi:hypothetical protein